MNKYIVLILFFSLFFSCKNKESEKAKKNITYVSFGDKISSEDVISKDEMAKKYENLKEGDTINVKFTSTIKGVCKKKGCWISVPLDATKNSFVKFKDYAFFMPMNSEGTDVILNGKAYINKIPVQQLKHYAKDAGKPDSIIAKITEPKIVYAFMADGVLLASEKNEK